MRNYDNISKRILTNLMYKPDMEKYCVLSFFIYFFFRKDQKLNVILCCVLCCAVLCANLKGMNTLSIFFQGGQLSYHPVHFSQTNVEKGTTLKRMCFPN